MQSPPFILWFGGSCSSIAVLTMNCLRCATGNLHREAFYSHCTTSSCTSCTLPYLGPGGGGGLLPYKRLMGMCRWMGSHFHDWID